MITPITTAEDFGMSSLFGGAAYSAIGDSITGANTTSGTTYTPTLGLDYANLVGVLSAGKLRIQTNHGIGGYTSTLILAQAEDVSLLKPRPRFCFIVAGTNDTGTMTADQTVANIQAMCNVLLGKGIVPIVSTIPPRTSPTDLQRVHIRRANILIRAFADRAGLICVDHFANCAARDTGDWASGYSDDGIHPNRVGQGVMAQGAFDAVNPFLPVATPQLSYQPVDSTKVAKYDDCALHYNPCMIDSDSNSYPDGWAALATTLTKTTPTAANIAGNWFKCVASSSSTGYLLYGQMDTSNYNTEQRKFTAVATNKLTAYPTLGSIAGQCIVIERGEGFTPGKYFVPSTNSGTATLHANCCNVGAVNTNASAYGRQGYGGGIKSGDYVIFSGRIRATGFTSGSYQIGLLFTGGTPANMKIAQNWTYEITATDGGVFSFITQIPTGTTGIIPYLYATSPPDAAELWAAQWTLYNLTQLGLYP